MPLRERQATLMPRRPRQSASPTGPTDRRRSRPTSPDGARFHRAIWLGLALLAAGLMLVRLEETLIARQADPTAGGPVRHEPAWATDKISHFNALLGALPHEPTDVGYVSELPGEAVPDSGWFMLARYALIPHRVVVGAEPRLVILNLPRASLVDQVIRDAEARVVARPLPTLALLDTAAPEAGGVPVEDDRP